MKRFNHRTVMKMDKQREKMEQVAKERERSRAESIQRKWTKREESDFFRVVSSYGIDYDRKKKSYDWTRFKNLAKLEKKNEEILSEYYKNFIIMCKKQCGIKMDDDLYDPTIEQISEDKARRTLDRIELLSKIREDIIMHPQLDERMKLCQSSADIPDWWVPGKHDRDLLIGVAKHGLARTDYHILNDPELSFQEVLRKQCITENIDSKDAIKLESHEDILRFDRNEILVKLEKGEGTLKIEKVGVKKESDESKKEKVKTEADQVELTLVKSEKKCEDTLKDLSKKGIVEDETPSESNTEIETEMESEDKLTEEGEPVMREEDDHEKLFENEVIEDKKVDECETPDDEQKSEMEIDKSEINLEEKSDETTPTISETSFETKPNEPAKLEKIEKSKPMGLDKETDVTKQAAELKAMFPDLEVIQPLSRLSQIDTFVLRDRQGSGALDFSETTVAQLFNNAVKWPKEHAIQMRLQHICYVVENNEWPVPKSYTAYTPGIGPEYDISIHETPNATPKRDTSTPMSVSEGSEVITITTDHCIPRMNSNKKRKRHIAIDVETERAKLHALLNSAHVSQLTNPLGKSTPSWDNDDSEESRRSTPVAQNMLQPPPAHQNAPRVLSMPYDLKYHMPSKSGTSTVIPGTSSTLTPIDLSSGLPKMNTPDIPKVSGQDIQSEVQDFSMPSKKQVNPANSKGKLDDMLNKLKKRNNCPVEEPVIGKEKKRRKLDEIVLGLSAAKEQSLFPEPSSKKQPVTPSVTVTPTSAPVSTSHAPMQKPFTITVTSVPSPVPATSKSSTLPSVMPSLSSSAKDSFTSFLAQAEQQNMLLKKQQQQQQRKSYEAMIADINKVADFSSKVNSYSHEAKVNKWLAEQQNSVVSEQPLSADYLSAASRRRRPRIDPSLLDWKKLTGEEHVPVMNRLTGKKLTGSKAPQLKRLGQWLIENPLFDVDPKWAELVKERGNLTHDLQKRLPPGAGNNKKGPGRPPLMASPTGTNQVTPVSSAAANLATSMASTLPFPSLATSGLGGLNSSLLSSLSLSQFDPKTNPLLLPFGGMSNMSALNSMGGLGSLGNMNLFANLAGLGIPGLSGMDAASLAAAAGADGGQSSGGVGGTIASSSSKSKSRKPSSDSHGGGGGGGQSSNKPPSSSSASSSGSAANTNTLPTTSPFPFFFPNPSLLYTPLGLGGLNPFTLQPGMSSAYDSLAQQCGLLNGTLGAAAAAAAAAASGGSPNSSRTGKSGASSSRGAGGSLTTTSSSTGTLTTASSGGSNKHQRLSSSRDAAVASAPLQQLLLPHDAHLLESISRVAGSLDIAKRKDDKKVEKRKNLENLSRAGLLPDFPSPDKLKVGKRDFMGNPAELSKFMELPGSSKRSREQEMKEALEQLSKTPAEFIARTLASEEQRTLCKRPRESKDIPENLTKDDIEQPLPPTKRMKESLMILDNIVPAVASSMAGPPIPILETGGVDIEALLTPSTVVKGPVTVETEEKPISSQCQENVSLCEEMLDEPTKTCSTSGTSPGSTSKDQDGSESGESGSISKKGSGVGSSVGGRRTRGKRKSGELDPEAPIIERKNLRSSAGRAAAAAAARAAAEQAAAKQQDIAIATALSMETGSDVANQEECQGDS